MAEKPENLVPPALNIRGLRKAYGAHRIFSDFDLTIEQTGQVVGIFGPNGVGKTTLFRCLMGLEPCTARALEWRGTSILGWPTHRIARLGVTLMFQRPVVLEGLTVAEQLAMIDEERHGRLDRDRLDAALADQQLTELQHHRADRLSWGEAKRLDFARVQLLDPRLVLLDEPFSALDPVRVERAQARIRSLATPERLVVLTDHRIDQALAFVDRVWVVHDGRVIFSGSAAAARADVQVREFYLGHHG